MEYNNQKDLTDALDRASVLYYGGFTTEFTDNEFDLALKVLQKMEKESGVIYPHSPTQRVGSDIQKEFKKIKHPKPMLTIENTYDDNELLKWANNIIRKINHVVYFNISVKYDGVSCELHYHDGILKSASTRGDKNIGDDITENVKTIKSVPLKLINCTVKDFYVRGEILMPKSQLKKVNEERLINDEQPFANTRNACSGSVKQLDPKVTASRGLIFRPWDCFSNDILMSDMTSKMLYLYHQGFQFEKGTESFTCFDVNNLTVAVSQFKETLDSLNLDYDYDGVVIKINSCDIQDEIGTKDTRAIEWGIARKWNEEYIAETIIEDIEWQVGKMGSITPVGKLKTVECAGVNVSNVTLHNWGIVSAFNLHPNDKITITRSGGVIPYVLSASHDGNDTDTLFDYPHVCPICGSETQFDGEILKCVNEKCPAIIKGQILHFCSKDCMDIRTIGEKVVDDLYEYDIVRSLEDIIALGGGSSYHINKLMKLKDVEGYGEKSVNKILDSLYDSRLNKPFDKVLASLSIPNVGKVMGRELANHYDDIFNFANTTVEELMTINGIAETIANDIVEWNKKNEILLDEVNYWQWNWMNEKFEVIEDVDNDTTLNGLTLVFTGKSSRFSGDEVEDFLESKGAKCGHSVSKKTNYLITGDKPGSSKVTKATELGVEIITEDDFYQKFGI